MKSQATLFLCLLCHSLFSQTNGDRIELQLGNPQTAGYLEASLVNGGIEIFGTDRNTLVIEARTRNADVQSDVVNSSGKAMGMRRVYQRATGLEVTEKNNRVTVSTKNYNLPIDLSIRLPRHMSLKLACVNRGDIYVENVVGDLEVNNVNGAVTLAKISGSVVAHALNKDLKVSFDRIANDKAMSFTSLNGDIDITLPPSSHFDLKMSSKQGEIHSDFDLELNSGKAKVEANRQGRGISYRISREKVLHGKLGNGGPVLNLETFNGHVYLRRQK